MSDIVFSKMIRVATKGRFITKKGITLGPERFFHKEETATIKELLMNYPTIEIEERTDRDKNIVKLSLLNYDKNNERSPIGMEEDVQPVPDEEPEKKEEDPVPVGDAVAEPVDQPVMADSTPVGNDDLAEAPAEEQEQPAAEPEKKEEEVTPQQQPNNGGKKKNKNKGQNKETTEVTPKEA